MVQGVDLKDDPREQVRDRKVKRDGEESVSGLMPGFPLWAAGPDPAGETRSERRFAFSCTRVHGGGFCKHF